MLIVATVAVVIIIVMCCLSHSRWRWRGRRRRRRRRCYGIRCRYVVARLRDYFWMICCKVIATGFIYHTTIDQWAWTAIAAIQNHCVQFTVWCFRVRFYIRQTRIARQSERKGKKETINRREEKRRTILAVVVFPFELNVGFKNLCMYRE